MRHGLEWYRTAYDELQIDASKIDDTAAKALANYLPTKRKQGITKSMKYLLAILLLLPACKTAPMPEAVNPSAIMDCSYNDTEHCGQYAKRKRN